MTDTANVVRMIPISQVTVLNPRLRNKRVFAELVASIGGVGLKKPITVRSRPGGSGYDLICGQGRLEAFTELGQQEIPAVVVEATEEDCYLMSLVENLARRQHAPLELLREIEVLRERGYDYVEMAEKTGLSPEYVHSICTLLSKGEHRLLKAVERGIMPHSVAMEIARSNDAEVQAALTEAYESKALPGNQVMAIRRIIEQRRAGKGRERVNDPKQTRKQVTGDSLVRAYKREMERQRLQVRKAELAQNRLLFVIGALRTLLADRHFETLLRAEAMPTMPKSLYERILADA
ncbi:MAG: plasmid partitioning protein RepB C-terminal domain-containing protein [Janthinobacterium lividum]